MSVEANKQMVTSTWKAFVQGDLKTAFANMSDEVSWLIPGNLNNLSGLRKGKAAILEFARNARAMGVNRLTAVAFEGETDPALARIIESKADTIPLDNFHCHLRRFV